MMQSKITLYIFLFTKDNNGIPTILVDKNNEPPSIIIDTNISLEQYIENLCKTLDVNKKAGDFKIVDCSIDNNIVNICFYTFLPFNYFDGVSKFIDIDQINIENYNNLKKIIRLI
jgi:hypothetical protein